VCNNSPPLPQEPTGQPGMAARPREVTHPPRRYPGSHEEEVEAEAAMRALFQHELNTPSTFPRLRAGLVPVDRRTVIRPGICSPPPAFPPPQGRRGLPLISPAAWGRGSEEEGITSLTEAGWLSAKLVTLAVIPWGAALCPPLPWPA